MNICQNCKNWKRWPKHRELTHQHKWGECRTLLLDADNFIAIQLEMYECFECYIESLETFEDFGCVLFQPNEKEDLQMAKRGD